MMDESKTKIVGPQLRKFAESTSVRGIPRVLKSNDHGLRVLWSVAVIVCTGLLIWQLSLILIRYYSYDVVTGVQEAGYNTVFPDITICKVSQLNTLYTSTLNYSTYISDTLSRKARWPIDRLSKSIPDFDEEIYNATWSHFLSKDGYYNSLPRDVKLTENEEVANNPFVLYCSASMWDESASFECVESFQIVWHRKYYKCSSLQLPDSMRRVVRSVAIVLYLNNFEQVFTSDGCCPNEDASQASGIRLSVQEHGVPTDMTRGVAVSPGSEATIVITENDRKRMSAPYGNCTTTSYLGEPSDNIGYSVHGCKQLCLQNKSIDECQCIDLQNRFTEEQLRSVGNVICGNQTMELNFENDTLSPEFDLQPILHTYCTVTADQPGTFDCPCFQPCLERGYDMTESAASPWPDPSFQKDFYERFIKETPYAYKFKPYEYILEAYSNGSIDVHEAVRRFDAQDLIRKNFVQLNVAFKYQNPHITIDKPAMTPDNLMSTIGGALSLWLGMTVMFFFEVVEATYMIVSSWYHEKKQRQTASVINIAPTIT